jgi:hypothetical protein
MQYFNVVLLKKKLDPTELPTRMVKMDGFGFEWATVLERMT